MLQVKRYRILSLLLVYANSFIMWLCVHCYSQNIFTSVLKTRYYKPWRCPLRRLSTWPGFVSSRRRCRRVSCGNLSVVFQALVSPSAMTQVPVHRAWDVSRPPSTSTPSRHPPSDQLYRHSPSVLSPPPAMHVEDISHRTFVIINWLYK